MKRRLSCLLMAGCVLLGLVRASVAVAGQELQRADLVWSDADGISRAVWFSAWQGDGWTAPVRITDDALVNLHPQVDGGADGGRLLAWTGIEHGSLTLRYSMQQGGSWSEPRTVATGLSSNIAPSVLIDGQNTAWMVWAGNDGGLDDVYSSRLVDGVWQKPLRVHPTNDVPDFLPQLSLSELGLPVVSWQSYRDGATRQLRSSWNGTSWSSPELLETSSGGGSTAMEAVSTPALPDFVGDPAQAFLRMYVAPAAH